MRHLAAIRDTGGTLADRIREQIRDAFDGNDPVAEVTRQLNFKYMALVPCAS